MDLPIRRQQTLHIRDILCVWAIFLFTLFADLLHSCVLHQLPCCLRFMPSFYFSPLSWSSCCFPFRKLWIRHVVLCAFVHRAIDFDKQIGSRWNPSKSLLISSFYFVWIVRQHKRTTLKCKWFALFNGDRCFRIKLTAKYLHMLARNYPPSGIMFHSIYLKFLVKFGL